MKWSKYLQDNYDPTPILNRFLEMKWVSLKKVNQTNMPIKYLVISTKDYKSKKDELEKKHKEIFEKYKNYTL